MADVRLTETERRVLSFLKQGLSEIDEIKLAMEKEVGHAYSRGVLNQILSRLTTMGVGVRKLERVRKNDHVRYGTV